MAVTAAGDRMGTIVLGGRADLDAGEQRTLERAAVVTALLLLFRLQSAEVRQRVRTDLLADLMAARALRGAELEALTSRGRLLGMDLGARHVVAVCRGGTGLARRSLLLAAGAALGGEAAPGLVGEHAGDVVVLVPGSDASQAACELADRLSRASSPVTVGAAGPVTPLAGVQAAYAEARRTADALVALGTPGRGASASDLGFAGLVVGGAPDVERYIGGVLGPVLDYDARRGSDLLGTLDAYFAAGASPSRAAGALHVHVNTVAQRLERIASLLGPDWSVPERALELQLALRLQRLRR